LASNCRGVTRGVSRATGRAIGEPGEVAVDSGDVESFGPQIVLFFLLRIGGADRPAGRPSTRGCMRNQKQPLSASPPLRGKILRRSRAGLGRLGCWGQTWQAPPNGLVHPARESGDLAAARRGRRGVLEEGSGVSIDGVCSRLRTDLCAARVRILWRREKRSAKPQRCSRIQAVSAVRPMAGGGLFRDPCTRRVGAVEGADSSARALSELSLWRCRQGRFAAGVGALCWRRRPKAPCSARPENEACTLVAAVWAGERCTSRGGGRLVGGRPAGRPGWRPRGQFVPSS